MMKVVFQKPDLDTCLAAVILGVCPEDEILSVPGGAGKKDLKNPSVICLEAGGSGQVYLNNFDHHDPCHDYPPACKQASDHCQIHDPILKRLVEYVCFVDEALAIHPPIEFPSLSGLFSGMLMKESNSKKQFMQGIKILKECIQSGVDPFKTMPYRHFWLPYIKAKHNNQLQLRKDFLKAEYLTSHAGNKIGFLKTTAIGGSGALYAAGCDIAVVYHPAFGDPPVKKVTISSKHMPVSILLPVLSEREKGWGGRRFIIGSPIRGTAISKQTVLKNLIYRF